MIKVAEIRYNINDVRNVVIITSNSESLFREGIEIWVSIIKKNGWEIKGIDFSQHNP